mgnify:CR=1 FL=1
MPSGRVRWFDANKGYGFIQNEQGADVFLPAAALPEGVKTLRKGAKVEYSVVEGRRGPQAMGLTLVASARLWSKQLDRSRMIWPPLWRILSNCWIPRGTSCAATIIHLRLKARNWPR